MSPRGYERSDSMSTDQLSGTDGPAALPSRPGRTPENTDLSEPLRTDAPSCAIPGRPRGVNTAKHHNHPRNIVDPPTAPFPAQISHLEELPTARLSLQTKDSAIGSSLRGAQQARFCCSCRWPKAVHILAAALKEAGRTPATSRGVGWSGRVFPNGADGTASPHVVDRCVERQDR